MNGSFRDDMSGTSANTCPDGCPRQMFFSDPTQDFMGRATRRTGGARQSSGVSKQFRCVNTFADYVFGDGLE